MKIKTILAAVVALTPILGAQDPLHDWSIVAASELKTESRQAHLLYRDTASAGTVIDQGAGEVGLETAASWFFVEARAKAVFRNVYTSFAGASELEIEEEIDVESNLFSTPSNAGCGPHSVLFSITPRDNRTLAGNLDIRQFVSGTANVQPKVATLRVDIGFAGLWDYEILTLTRFDTRVPVTIPPSGLKILVETQLGDDTNRFRNWTFRRTVNVFFRPYVRGNAFFSHATYGVSCGTPSLAGSELFTPARNLVYDVSRAPANAPGVLLVGLTWTYLPYGGCIVHASPTVLVPMNTDPLGRSRLMIPIAPLLTGKVYAQFLGLEGPTLRASPGLDSTGILWPTN